MRYILFFLLYVLLGLLHERNGVALAAVLDQKEVSGNRRLRVHPRADAGEDHVDKAQLLEGDTVDDRERMLDGLTMKDIGQHFVRVGKEYLDDRKVNKLVRFALSQDNVLAHNIALHEKLYKSDLKLAVLKRKLKLPEDLNNIEGDELQKEVALYYAYAFFLQQKGEQI
ncbi:hypothetical protein KXD40_005007 [Peronospora effusa]|uniref:RxLR effector protein n=1 Tax=Peronospora effusa TaxID=542832 RepID=A0A3M6V838_9STRA|nr:hypothetical protein DD238_003859 [Peronospora effusa]RQM10977.1 hypothetical protein DD237_004254 [Peronospora effusa]UIZ22152.1 hypothetical protein KXD40_005007 [Peronospora effusa]